MLAMVCVAAFLPAIAFGGVWRSIAIIPIAAFIVVGLADRDAIVARRAIIEYSGIQAGRRPQGYPTDREAADTWLADPENAGENPVRRAYILVLAERADDARAELDRVDASDPSDVASAERLRATWDAADDGTWDASRFEQIVASLPEDERRWQRLALAWMFASDALRRVRPWRDEFVRSVRDLGPWHTPARGWFVIVTQQFTFAIVLAFVSVLLPVFFRL
jgi:hypothetical protein